MIAITMITTGRPGWIRPPKQPSAPEHGVDPAAVEAGDQADRHADHDRGAGRDERHLERDSGAVDRAREDVAAEPVDAERVLAGRARRRAEDVERLRALRLGVGRAGDRHDRRREESHRDEQDDEDERDHRDLVAAQAAPEELHRRARRDPLLGGALLDYDALVVGLVYEPGGIAGAHASALTVRGAMSMMFSLLRPATFPRPGDGRSPGTTRGTTIPASGPDSSVG